MSNRMTGEKILITTQLKTFENNSFFHSIMKKSSILFIALALSTTLIPSSAYATQSTDDWIEGASASTQNIVAMQMPDIASPYAVVYDDNGTEIYSRGGDTQTKIASVTKIMTALIASEYQQDAQVTITALAADTTGSTCNIQAGDVTTLHELMEGLLLPSGNDAAYAIAIHCGTIMLEEDDAADRSETAAINRFVEAMNTTAESLEMNNTLFTNPCGLDDGAYTSDSHSTASDVAKMTKAALQREEIATIAKEDTAMIDVTRNGVATGISIDSTNRLLGYREDVNGLKTGHTSLAGYCFAGAFTGLDGNNYYTVVLDASDYDTVFADTEELFSWVNESRDTYNLVSSLTLLDNGYYDLGEFGVPAWADKTVSGLVDDTTYTKWFWDEGAADYTITTSIPDGDIAAGDDIGDIVFTDSEGNIIAESDIIAGESVSAPGFLDSIGIFFSRAIDYIGGGDGIADDSVNQIGAAEEV